MSKRTKKIAEIVATPLVNEMKADNFETRSRLKDIRDENDEIKDVVLDIIDSITMPDEEKEVFLKTIKEKYTRNQKIAQFKVRIVYDKKDDEEFANNLRKSLANQKNTTIINDYEDYKKKNTSTVDYNIFIGNPDEINGEEIFNSFGCIIRRNEKNLTATYDDKNLSVKNHKESFIKYYTDLTNQVFENEKELNKIVFENEEEIKVLKKKRENDEKRLRQGDTPFTEKFMNVFESASDKILDVADDAPPLLGMLIAALSAPVVLLAGAILVLPVGISEVTARYIAEELQDSNFDRKFIAEAQRHILQIKLCEFVSNEQIKQIE